MPLTGIEQVARGLIDGARVGNTLAQLVACEANGPDIFPLPTSREKAACGLVRSYVCIGLGDLVLGRGTMWRPRGMRLAGNRQQPAA